MALQFSLNRSANFSVVGLLQVMYDFKEHLKTLGWTVVLSGDGSTQYGASDYITSYAVLAVSHAWFVIRSPDNRYYLFDHAGGSISSGVIAYSPVTAFTGGSATTPPTTSDNTHRYLIGDATHTMNLGYSGSGTMYYNFIVDNAAPYGWWVFGFTSAFGNNMVGWGCEPLLAGSYNPSDLDPYVHYIGEGLTDSFNVDYDLGASGSTYDSYGFKGWYKYPSGTWISTPALGFKSYSNRIIPNGLGASPYNGNDQLIPMIFGRYEVGASIVSGFSGYKGVSSMMMWNGTTRAMGTTFNGKTRISLRDCSVPWDGATTPLA